MDQGYGNLAWECVCAWMTRDLWKSNSYLWVEGACQLTWKIWFAGLRAPKGCRLVEAEGSWLVPEACGPPRDEAPASAWLGRPRRPPDNGRTYSGTGRRRPGETGAVGGWEADRSDRWTERNVSSTSAWVALKDSKFNPFSYMFVFKAGLQWSSQTFKRLLQSSAVNCSFFF